MLKYRKIYYSLSALLVVASISFFFMFGLKFGIDFRGGSLMQLEFAGSSAPSTESIQSVLEGLSLGSDDPAAKAPDEVKRKANEALTKDLERTQHGTWYSKTDNQHFCPVCMASGKPMPIKRSGGSSTTGLCVNFKECGVNYPNLFPQYDQTTEPEERDFFDFDSRYDS